MTLSSALAFKVLRQAARLPRSRCVAREPDEFQSASRELAVEHMMPPDDEFADIDTKTPSGVCVYDYMASHPATWHGG